MTNRILRPLHTGYFLLLCLISSSLLYSCNAKEEDVENDNYVSTESVAITAFSLSADLRVMKNLDSVFFSIDLEHGVVFNADSLPKGTNVTKLIPKISYPSSVTSAVIEMTGGTHRNGTVNYFSTPNDTIDFTGNVTLTLGTAENAIQKTYTLKVNVHKEDPDTMYWTSIATSGLPSRMEQPAEQKSVKFGPGVVSLIKEKDNTFTLARTSDIFSAQWDNATFEGGFTPQISTLQAGNDGCLYVLADNGDLWMSEDTKSWTNVASGWSNIIGPYGEIMLGIKTSGAELTQACYPDGMLPELTLPSDFPLTGFTSPIQFTNRWTPYPTIVIFGGYPYSASGKSPSWAFDGSQWVNIAENALPALSGMSVVSYYSYLKSATNSLLKEFEVYLAFGGRDAAGKVNKTIYVSYDHGINWQKAQEYIQFPASVSAGYMVNALSLGTTLESNLSNRWKAAERRRLPHEIDGDIVSWECPYIFLFGGYDANGNLNPLIRSGVLQRLTFVPLF